MSSQPPHASPGLGAANVCDLETASPDDALLAAMVAASSGTTAAAASVPHPPAALTVMTTALLSDVRQHIVTALAAHQPYVSKLQVRGAGGGGDAWRA